MLELATQAYPLTLMGAALGFPDQQDLAATLEVDKAIRDDDVEGEVYGIP